MLNGMLVRTFNGSCVLCLSLVLLLVLNVVGISECRNREGKTSIIQQPVASIKGKQPQAPRLNNVVSRFRSRQTKSDEFGKLSKDAAKAINDNNEGQSKLVYPSKETNGNSQVVYVNWGRVINDINKNETTRVVDNNQLLIKQDAQIACGETNRNGIPSLSIPIQPTDDPLPNRIVGGTRAEPGEYPFQVRLNIRSRRGSSLCGGVIIDQRHILTAAHCMTTW